MKTFLLSFALAGSMALAGCATSGSGSTVDYTALAQNTCGIATSEIAALESVSADLSATDQTTLAKIAPVVDATCAAVTASNGQLSYTTVTAILTQLTVIAVAHGVQPK